jgi:maltose alpha-D-glucosyltransferase/alpha-amylase
MPPRFEEAVGILEDAVRRSAAFRVWLRSRRWCGETVGMRSELVVRDSAILATSGTEALVLTLVLAKDSPSSVLLHLPFSVATARLDPGAFELSSGPERWYVVEAERRESYARFLAEGLRKGLRLRTHAGASLHLQGESLGAFRSWKPGAEGDSSNLLVHIATVDKEVVYKSYKILDSLNREPQILERLRRRGFAHVPRFLGELSLGQGEERIVLGVANQKIDAEDLFAYLTGRWREGLRQSSSASTDVEEVTLRLADGLGEATAALHDTLVDRKPGPFQAEPFTPEDAQAAYRIATRNLTDSTRLLSRRRGEEGDLPSDLASECRELLLDHRKEIERVLGSLEASVGTVKSVTHADLHLGQVLRSRQDGSLSFIDFEGEPERSPGQRSAKLPPLRDVATIVRSFAYAKHTAWRDFLGGEPRAALRAMRPHDLSSELQEVLGRLQGWEDTAVRRFPGRYLARTSLYPEVDQALAQRIIRGWTMEKALYELRYELRHRPANFLIPLEGILSLASPQTLSP